MWRRAMLCKPHAYCGRLPRGDAAAGWRLGDAGPSALMAATASGAVGRCSGSVIRHLHTSSAAASGHSSGTLCGSRGGECMPAHVPAK